MCVCSGSVKIISPSEASVEKAKTLSSPKAKKQSAGAINCKLEESAQEKREELIKPLSAVKFVFKKEITLIWLVSQSQTLPKEVKTLKLQQSQVLKVNCL